MNPRPASRLTLSSVSEPSAKETLERKWQRVILWAIPLGMLAFLLAMPLEHLSQQWTPYDLVYPIVLLGFMIAEIILAFRWHSLRSVIFSLVIGSSLFFLGKLCYTLFIVANPLLAHKQMGESFYWTPVIYLLCFLIPGVRGGWIATVFTSIFFVISSSFAITSLGAMTPERWGMIFMLTQLNLVNVVQLILSFAFISLKTGYTQSKEQVEALEEVLHTDALTGLPNRLKLQQILDEALLKAKQNNELLAVLFIDIDRFKLINDTLGHSAGDALLEHVAKRLSDVVRDGDFVARISGDEFVVIAHMVDKVSTVRVIAQRILASLSAPFEVAGQTLSVTVSIGSSLFPDDAESAESLIRHADSAMYKVKKQGKNGFEAYQKTDVTLERRWQLEKDLKGALETQGLSAQGLGAQGLGARQFALHYQPMYDLQTGGLVKLEALLRWKHPQHGSISPAEFIPVAEESGLIVPLGTWVLEEACRQAKIWQSRHKNFRMSVNVSLLQFSHPGFFAAVINALKDSGLSGEYLELELTESIVMNQPGDVKQVLANIQRLGIRIAIDDFGTGYSSLAYLRDLPIDTVKIDRSFVRDLTEQGKDVTFSRALVETIVGLAKHLELEVVAEGVETEAQRNLLKQLGCHIGQGYFFAKPLAAEEFDVYLQKLPKRLAMPVAQMN
jgi:diguanylate cyclase